MYHMIWLEFLEEINFNCALLNLFILYSSLLLFYFGPGHLSIFLYITFLKSATFDAGN